jgi:hypothetical protein
MSVVEAGKSARREKKAGNGWRPSGEARDSGDGMESFVDRFEKIDKAIHQIAPRVLVLVVVVGFVVADIFAVIKFLLM